MDVTTAIRLKSAMRKNGMQIDSGLSTKVWILFIIIMLAMSPRGQAQIELIQSQQELVGSKIWPLTFTNWLKNVPIDSNFTGKYKVLEFWATWCRPCLQAVPHLNKLQRKMGDSNIVFLSVTYETPEVTAKTFDKVDFETIVVSDTTRRIHRSLRIEYNGSMVIPRTVLLDGKNNILWYGTPKSLSEKLIRSFMNR